MTYQHLPNYQHQISPTGVSYPGFTADHVRRYQLHCGRSLHLELKVDDLLTLVNSDGGVGVLVYVIDDEGNSALESLGLKTALKTPHPNPSPQGRGALPEWHNKPPLPQSTVSNETSVGEGVGGEGNTTYLQQDLVSWLKTQGGNPENLQGTYLFNKSTPRNERLILKATANCTIWLLLPVPDLGSETGAGGTITLEHSPASQTEEFLPIPLGKVREEIRINRSTAQAYTVKKGEYIQVIDVAGRQCSDFMAMRSSALDQGLERFIDSTATRSMVGGAYPQPGLFDKFFDQDLRPLLAVTQDTVGRHDTFALACTARGYEERGYPGHINCSDNISAAYQPYGIQQRRAWPAINFFFNSWISTADNQLSSDEAWSRPGDYVLMQALTDLVCVSTACPDDVDPINGWNPTDIHVRIYQAENTIPKAIAHRPFAYSEASMTEHSPFHERTSKLTNNYHVARDVWLPQNYDATRTIAEYWACRNAVTLQDMSSLRKYDILGPDAEKLLQLAMSRDIAKLSINRGTYALMLTESGTVIDDGTLFRLSHDTFRWCCGTEESGRQLQTLAEQEGLKVWVKSMWSAMPNLAIQGPKSRDLLRKLIFTQPHQPTLDNVRWFGFNIARLHDRDGVPFMLTRTGFTGELGYEIFCDSAAATEIWDAVMTAGEEFGITPMGGEALETIRIEAGLMMAGHEFDQDTDALEAGLEFAVDFRKTAFVGREALMRNREAPRKKLVGLLLEGSECPAHGDLLFAGNLQVGVITSATRSPMLERPIAMARVNVETLDKQSHLEVGRLDGQMKRLNAEISTIPFFDPKRERARA